MLSEIDEYASNEKKTLVIVFDEFQHLATIKGSEHIEASIRHAAERVKASTYLFSGSNRHLLASMFEDRNRPLFQMSFKLILGRIHEDDYCAFLIKMAKKRWQKAISQTAIITVLELTSRHPSYVNLLCYSLWQESSPPTPNSIRRCWEDLSKKQYYLIESLLQSLSTNQYKLLKLLAHHPTKKPIARDYIKKANLANSSAAQALKMLEEKDMIYKNENDVWHVLDPFVQYELSKLS